MAIAEPQFAKIKTILTMEIKEDIRKFTLEQIKEHLISMHEPAFRAKQIYEWLWKKSAQSFEEMTNLSKPLRESLDKSFAIRPIVQTERSSLDSFYMMDTK
jgi:adenine C2-methylase RlmN of 23S rRNA A2503 and tRNA A37